MSNFKTGNWCGDKERATRLEYNRKWRKRHPNYHKDYNDKYNASNESQNPHHDQVSQMRVCLAERLPQNANILR